jgi:hypothetical protein
LGQRAATPINHHDAAGRLPGHGRSVSGVPIPSSSLRVSACSARWITTRSPSARIASRRTRRASASAISRTNALSPLPCPLEAQPLAQRRAAGGSRRSPRAPTRPARSGPAATRTRSPR